MSVYSTGPTLEGRRGQVPRTPPAPLSPTTSRLTTPWDPSEEEVSPPPSGVRVVPDEPGGEGRVGASWFPISSPPGTEGPDSTGIERHPCNGVKGIGGISLRVVGVKRLSSIPRIHEVRIKFCPVQQSVYLYLLVVRNTKMLRRELSNFSLLKKKKLCFRTR